MSQYLIIEAALCAILATAFAVSAAPKLRNPKGFILVVLDYRVLPDRLARWYAQGLPPAEVFISLLLLLGIAVRAVALAASLLLGSFITAIVINLVRGRDLNCGCYGKEGGRIGWKLVLLDMGLLASSLVLAFLISGWTNLAPWSACRTLPISAGATAVVAPAACALVVVAMTVALRRTGDTRRRRWKDVLEAP